MNKCTIEGCERIRSNREHGWCKMHYKRWQSRGGDPAHYLPTHKERGDAPDVLKRRLEKKFKIDPETECWNWTGWKVKSPQGYPGGIRGQMEIDGKRWGVHRISWRVYRGEIPKGAHVLHTCDNTLCVNPAHLYLGDHQKNMKDMSERHRTGHGRLTPDAVEFIRASKLKQFKLAAIFGVSQAAISKVQMNLTYKHDQEVK